MRALLVDADGAGPERRIAAWRSLVDGPADDLLAVWHRHLARCRLALALLDAGERDAAAALLAEVRAAASGDGVARVGRWAAELTARARLAPAAEAEQVSEDGGNQVEEAKRLLFLAKACLCLANLVGDADKLREVLETCARDL